MKYITTKEHPIFKGGIEFQMGYDTFNLFAFYIKGISGKMFDVIKESDLEIWLKEGYIKEVEEKEFYPSEMVAFARWYSNHSEFEESGIEILKIWLTIKESAKTKLK